MISLSCGADVFLAPHSISVNRDEQTFNDSLSKLNELKLDFREKRVLSWPLIVFRLNQLFHSMPLERKFLIVYRQELFWLIYYIDKFFNTEKSVKKRLMDALFNKLEELNAVIPISTESTPVDATLIHFKARDDKERLWHDEKTKIESEISIQKDEIVNFIVGGSNLKEAFFWVYGEGYKGRDIESLFQNLARIEIEPMGNGANKIVLKLDLIFINPEDNSELKLPLAIKTRRPGGYVEASEIILSNMLSGKNFPVFGSINSTFNNMFVSTRPVWMEELIDASTPVSIMRQFLDKPQESDQGLENFWRDMAKQIVKAYFFFFYDTLELSTYVSDPNTGNLLLRSQSESQGAYALAEIGAKNFKIDLGRVSHITSKGDLLKFVDQNGIEFFQAINLIYNSSIKPLERLIENHNIGVKISLNDMISWIFEEIEPGLERIIILTLLNKGILIKLETLWSKIEEAMGNQNNITPSVMDMILKTVEADMKIYELWVSEGLDLINREMTHLPEINENSFEPFTVDFKWMGVIKINEVEEYIYILDYFRRHFDNSRTVFKHTYLGNTKDRQKAA